MHNYIHGTSQLPLTNYKPGEFPGAPWHPHRGMDTVMYVKQGRLGHEDSMGNKGVLEDGDCQVYARLAR